MNDLTPKQALFVAEYLRDANATAAAVRAGYSERTANQQGPRLLENAAIVAALDAAKAQRSLETGIDSRWILRSLVEEATADIADLFNPKTGDLLPVHRWPMIWRTGLVQGLEIEVLFDGHGKDREQIGVVKKIKLDSRIRRKELIGKHVKVQAFQETVQHKGLEGLADRLARAKARGGDLLEGAFKRDAASSPAIEIAPPSDAPSAAEPKLSNEADAEAVPALETRQEQMPPTVEGSTVENRYAPIMPSATWPQEAEHVITDYDPLTNDER